MRTLVFSAKPYDREFLAWANDFLGTPHDLIFHDIQLDQHTARLAEGCEAASIFVNDEADADTLRALKSAGVSHLALRSAGFNHVDLKAAEELGIELGRVPAYSPAAVAEHAVALMLTLNRKIHRAYARVREGNFALQGLMGFDMKGRTIGLIGTGSIGLATARILNGFGCRLLANDPVPNSDFESLGGEYVVLDNLLRNSDIISLHCPLTPETKQLIDRLAITSMKDGVMLINTCRGAVVDTRAVIDALKSSKIGSFGLDVYEEEDELFFEDRSNEIIQDDIFARLLTFPNVLVTSHQGFFTRDAMQAIAEATIANITAFASFGHAKYPVGDTY